MATKKKTTKKPAAKKTATKAVKKTAAKKAAPKKKTKKRATRVQTMEVRGKDGHISKWWIFWTYLFGVIMIAAIAGGAYIAKYPETLSQLDEKLGATILQDGVDAFCLESLFDEGERNILEVGDFVYKQYPGKVIQATILHDSDCPECLSPNIETNLAFWLPTAVINKVDARQEGVEGVVVNSLPYVVLDKNVENSAFFSRFANKLEKQGDMYLMNTLHLEPSGLRTSVNKADLESAQAVGSVNAPLTVIEYVDYECEPCKKFYEESWTALNEQFISRGQVRYIIKNRPIGETNGSAYMAANAALCAADQGKFFEMHAALYENQGSLDEHTINDLAVQQGIGNTEFSICMTDRNFDTQIGEEIAESKKVGITGLPGFLIGDKLLIGYTPYENFDALLRNELIDISTPIERTSGGNDIQDEPTKGTGDILIKEFVDFSSPASKEAANTIDELLKIYEGKIQISSTNLPSSISEESQLAAQAAECAAQSGAYWAYYSLLLDNQGDFRRDTLERLGRQIGLGSEFISCVRVGDLLTEVTHDIDYAKANGVTKTPSYVLDGNLIEGAPTLEEWKTLINDILEKQAPTT